MAAYSESALTEPHQIKLSKFLTKIPALGAGQLKSIMPDSTILKTPFTKDQLDAFKGVKSNPDFLTYTGYDQLGLLTKWLSDRTTTCNEFCSKCGSAMGYVAKGKFDGVGRFDIADYLTRTGRGHCWVPASSGSKPEYGDVFRIFELAKDQNGVNRNHMGVSLFLDGSTWYTVESGQGGPSTGYDAIERKQRDWMPSSLQGWVNMKALIATEARLPHWLGGWWEVKQGPKETWYYFFEAGGKVSYTPTKPAALSQPPAFASMIGSFVVKGMFGVDVSWRSSDADETFMLAQQDSTKRIFTMTGKTLETNLKLTATRLMITGLL